MDFGVQCHCLQILGNEILDDNAVLPAVDFQTENLEHLCLASNGDQI